MSDKGFGFGVEGEYMERLTLFPNLGISLSSRHKVCKEGYLEVLPGLSVQVLLRYHRYDRCHHSYTRRQD